MLRSMILAAALAAGFLASPGAPSAPPPPPTWKVVAWNDLGMHCMDADYSVFSILPPFNDLRAQVVDPTGLLVGTPPTGTTLSYEAVADDEGSINATSGWKTNYWQFAGALFGASSTPDTGLAGHPMPGPGNVPQPLAFDGAKKLYGADGVPITPYDDAGRKRTYPLMRVALRNAAGTVLASTKSVLPVSDELDCKACHASGGAAAAEPVAGWVYDANARRDERLNVLRKHDDLHLGSAAYQAALAAAGFSAAGLYAHVASGGAPILCAKCHASNALPGTGLPGITPLTQAMHAGHAGVVDPATGLSMDAQANRASCYRCHPGSETKCLRGAMGSSVAANGDLAIQCQDCHGGMSAVGAAGRAGWLDEPSCQNCHTGTATTNSGQIRYTNAFSSPGVLRTPADATFATNPATPAPGFSLYKLSAGHGALQCEACHGSTHAEYPATHGNDNKQSLALQGHVGTLVECAACHATRPDTVDGGPHGLHPIDQQWVSDHGDWVENNGWTSCARCHGADAKGTVLSLAQASRSFVADGVVKTYFRGERVSCYGCHDGPNDDDATNNTRPVASAAQISVVDQPTTVTLSATDPNGNPLTYRIVTQPEHGRVALTGTTATYLPDPGFAGVDAFTFAAWDGKVDSNLATVTVLRGATWSNFGAGYPGTGGAVPAFTLDARPVLGTTPMVHLGNTTGTPGRTGLVVFSTESAAYPTGLGGVLLVRPDVFFFVTLPAAGLDFPWPLPNLPALTGTTYVSQLIHEDPGAPFGFAFSRGIRSVLGP